MNFMIFTQVIHTLSTLGFLVDNFCESLQSSFKQIYEQTRNPPHAGPTQSPWILGPGITNLGKRAFAAAV
jgi:hypothetical protein